MDEKDKQAVRDTLLETVEAALDAQLRAVRRLRAGTATPPPGRRRTGRSQVDYAEDILRRAGAALHVTEILAQVAQRYHVEIDRESLVSSLTKKVERGDRFVRTAPNTFALRPPR